jgi:hypothetical protein
MPYSIERLGSQYAVVDDKGKTVGTHPSKSKAEAQVRALYANVPDDSMGKSYHTIWGGSVLDLNPFYK